MKFIIGFILGFILATTILIASEDISLEPLFNRVFNDITDTLSVKGI